jgi:hypothetical protein
MIRPNTITIKAPVLFPAFSTFGGLPCGICGFGLYCGF